MYIVCGLIAIMENYKMAAGNDSVGEKKKIQVGAVVCCKTNLGEKFEGEVMGYDEETKAVVISIFLTTMCLFPKEKT